MDPRSPILENKYWYRVPKIMREHVDDLVNKAIFIAVILKTYLLNIFVKSVVM